MVVGCLPHAATVAAPGGVRPERSEQAPCAAALRPLGEGDFTFAFTRGASVVRVARHAQAATALARESCLLARIAGELPLPVPRPQFHHRPDCPPFAIHTLVEGEVLTEASWSAQTRDARERTAVELGRFLGALHAIPVSRVAACDLASRMAPGMARTLRASIEQTVARALSAADARRIRTFLDTESARVTAEPPVLLHNDLAPGHVLYDPRRGSLTGVIDFGDVVVGERARDLIYVLEDFGETFFNTVLAAYTPTPTRALLRRIMVWRLLESVEWAHQGLVAGDQTRTREGLQAIEALLEAQ